MDSSARLQLHRSFAPLDLVRWTPQPPERAEKYPDVDPLYAPDRQVDTSPPDARVDLSIRLGEEIGDGRSSVVFEALVLDEQLRSCLPPLVAKVCRYKRRGHMARESWFYDELWPLQGVAVARCYGWFEAEIPESEDVWGPDRLNLTSSRPPNPFPPDVEPDEYDVDDCDDGDDKELPKPWGKRLDGFARVYNKVSILLLERLGELYEYEGKGWKQRIRYARNPDSKIINI